MYRTILVPVDGSEVSRRALEHAVGIAEGSGATVHALAVVEPTGSRLGFDADDTEALDRAVGELADAILAANGTTDVELESEVRRGRELHETILDYADEVDADLLVMGRRGTASLPERILGSTADRISRLADIPVVLVPGETKG